MIGSDIIGYCYHHDIHISVFAYFILTLTLLYVAGAVEFCQFVWFVAYCQVIGELDISMTGVSL